MENSKLVMINGCSRGLGRALVDGFIARGDRVAGCARSSAVIEDLNGQFCEKGHYFKVADIAQDGETEAFCHELVKKLGVPDLVINCAALINQSAPLWKISASEFSDVIDVNLKGSANIIRHITPFLIEKGSGVIVNFSSYWGRSTSSDVAPYCATKWGIEGLTGALAQDLPRGIAAVAFNPGVIDTDMLRTCFGEAAGSYSGPEKWAEAAVPFLANLDASDNGASVTCPGQ